MRVAVVIPHYNHHRQIESVLASLLSHSLPVYVVDDGSEAHCRDALHTVLASYPAVRLVQRLTTGGKGAAVMQGFRSATQADYTHVLQVDADGQHALDDVPSLLAKARQNPAAIVTGAPQFADDMPLSRRLGRHLTHFFVMLETLSRRVGDTMCGFRVYPLASTVRLIDSAALGERMDFDIEIMVRADWVGIPICHVPTRVNYPMHGISHFHYVRDNVRITAMHTRLMLGMLRRAPMLVKRWFK